MVGEIFLYSNVNMGYDIDDKTLEGSMINFLATIATRFFQWLSRLLFPYRTDIYRKDGALLGVIFSFEENFNNEMAAEARDKELSAVHICQHCGGTFEEHEKGPRVQPPPSI